MSCWVARLRKVINKNAVKILGERDAAISQHPFVYPTCESYYGACHMLGGRGSVREMIKMLSGVREL